MKYNSDYLDEAEVIKNIGLRVKKRREITGYTQEKIAELMDCSTTTISRLENGQQCMSVKNMVRLANVLKTDMSDFFADYKFSDTYVLKSEDEQIKELLRECTVQQKEYFIKYLKWVLENYPHFQP